MTRLIALAAALVIAQAHAETINCYPSKENPRIAICSKPVPVGATLWSAEGDTKIILKCPKGHWLVSEVSGLKCMSRDEMLKEIGDAFKSINAENIYLFGQTQ